MLRRLAQVLTALAVVSVPALVGGVPPAFARPGYAVSMPTTFSPNGDGVKDTVRVRYSVPKPTRVLLRVTKSRTRGRVLRTVDLGWQPRGTYRWTWDGRSDRGRLLGQGTYFVMMVLPSADGPAGDRVKIDTTFHTTLQTPAYGAGDGRARVFPRSTEVEDAVELTAQTNEHRVRSMRLVIRNAAGKVVRDADVDKPLIANGGHTYGHGRTVRWAGRRGDKPLPKGRYTAVVTGRDEAGNRGRSEPLRIWVSADQLVWRETTTTMLPTEHRFGPCTYSSANGCGDFPDCGEVVRSTLFAGGLSYRSEPCAVAQAGQPRANTYHLLEVAEAAGVRGVSAVRVAFSGAPTVAGDPDVGTLRVWGKRVDSEVVGTSGQSGWVMDPLWGAGDAGEPDRYVQRRDPAATWNFSTAGTDSVDVATFTVDMRYLVIAD